MEKISPKEQAQNLVDIYLKYYPIGRYKNGVNIYNEMAKKSACTAVELTIETLVKMKATKQILQEYRNLITVKNEIQKL